jgi:hypothetical protein
MLLLLLLLFCDQTSCVCIGRRPETVFLKFACRLSLRETQQKTDDRAGDCYARPTTVAAARCSGTRCRQKTCVPCFFRTITALLFWQRFSYVVFSIWRHGGTKEKRFLSFSFSLRSINVVSSTHFL